MILPVFGPQFVLSPPHRSATSRVRRAPCRCAIPRDLFEQDHGLPVNEGFHGEPLAQETTFGGGMRLRSNLAKSNVSRMLRLVTRSSISRVVYFGERASPAKS